MENKKSPLPEHVIRAMRRDDGYIRAEATAKGVRYIVHLLTANGYKRHCSISYIQFHRLYKEGYIKHAGDGKWKLTDKGKEG